MRSYTYRSNSLDVDADADEDLYGSTWRGRAYWANCKHARRLRGETFQALDDKVGIILSSFFRAFVRMI
jgi:hypothetical protein